MIKKTISVSYRIFMPRNLKEMDIDGVLNCIKTGNFFGQDLIGITRRIQAETNHDKQNDLKKNNLPVAMFNGVVGYKSDDNIIEYSCFTAMDFDQFQNEVELQAIGRRLVITPCVYAVFRTPSGKGLKAIVRHDNLCPDYHGELYAQLLNKFEISTLDACVSDLSRGNYLCYDPYVFINPNYEVYHFEHDPAYHPIQRIKAQSVKKGLLDISNLRLILGFKRPVGNKSDESIMAIINSKWKRDYDSWRVGNRANSIFKLASQFCNAGVNIDKALNNLVKEYAYTGLDEKEIVYQAIRGYQNNASNYGSTRMTIG